jgi:hypothetical protein
MAFSDAFAVQFTQAERETDLYKKVLEVGILTEKTIYQEIDSEIRASTEFLAFTDSRLRSWLGALLVIVETIQKRIGKENPTMDSVRVRERAIAEAITYCKEHNILKDFFEKLSPEEVNMLTAEWNLEDALKVAREESWEDGWEKGSEDGWEKGRKDGREKEREWFSSLMSQAKSIDDLKQMFETTSTRQS